MLAGHYGPAYALKAARPDLPLGALCLAAQLPDLLWAAFALAGPERASVDPHPPAGTPAVRLAAAPYSHSLLAVLGWAAAAGAGLRLLPGPAGARRRGRPGGRRRGRLALAAGRRPGGGPAPAAPGGGPGGGGPRPGAVSAGGLRRRRARAARGPGLVPAGDGVRRQRRRDLRAGAVGGAASGAGGPGGVRGAAGTCGWWPSAGRPRPWRAPAPRRGSAGGGRPADVPAPLLPARAWGGDPLDHAGRTGPVPGTPGTRLPAAGLPAAVTRDQARAQAAARPLTDRRPFECRWQRGGRAAALPLECDASGNWF